MDFSFSEILLVVCAAIIFLKPEDLPKILRTISDFVRKVREFSDEILSSVKGKDIKPGSPKRTKIMGLDGKEYDAYDIEDVFPEERSDDKNV